MKKNLEILEIEAKLTKDEKKYWRVKTNEDWMSCFNETAIDTLKGFVGVGVDRIACCEVTEKKGTNFKGEDTIFHNIIKCYGKEEDLGGVEVVKPGEVVGKNNVVPNKSTTMYASYAKDVFCEIVDLEKNVPDQMDLAIELVKQAKEAFE